MNCSCQWDEKGNVVGGCGAHYAWARELQRGTCVKEEHKDFDVIVKNALYQTKRADTFERMIVERS